MAKRTQKKRKITTSVKINPIVGRYLLGSIVGLLSILLTLSFTQSEGLPAKLNQHVRNLVGNFVFVIPLLLLQLSLVVIGIRKLIVSRFYVVLGSYLSIISLIGLTRSGLWGMGLYNQLGSFITGIGAVVLLILTSILGILIAFNISLDQLSFAIIKILYLIRKRFEKVEVQVNLDYENEEKQAPLPAREVLDSYRSSEVLRSVKGATQLPLKATENESGKENEIATNTQLVLSKPWVLPPTSILSAPSTKGQSQSRIKQQAQTIIDTLGNAGIEVELGERPHIGPAVTQFALKLNDSNKLTKISTMSQILAYALAAPTGQIRIEAPIPGKTLVGIEVPNDQIETVGLRTILEANNTRENNSPTLIALGKDLSGEAVSYELSKMPHLLIAGTTGSGKSICIHSIIQSILFRTPPTQVRMILVDAKRVELNNYSDIPYLLTPVITDVNKVVPALRWCVQEMYNRLKIFEQDGSKNLADYNKKHPESTLPYIMVVIDELNDIMMQSPRDTEENIVKLAQMARAPGIHLVLATQRPDVNVITGLIKANIPARIAFALPQMQDSRTIIDQPGAEKLLGRGDMLFLAPDKGKPYRIQGSFITTDEINTVMEFVKGQNVMPQYLKIESGHNINTSDATEADSSSKTENDPMFTRALEIFLTTNEASASLLQTKLNIGYNKASRIFSICLDKGFVGEATGSKGRRPVNSLLIKEYLNQRS